MTYFFTYLQELGRVVQATMIDDRANQFPANADGNVIQPLVDAVVDSVGADSLPYKIENETGSLAGFFVLLIDRTNFTASIQKQVIRTPFQSDLTNIDAAVAAFIASDEWKEDIFLTS